MLPPMPPTVALSDVTPPQTSDDDEVFKTTTFQDQPIRIVMDGGLPWFAATDICKALKLPIGAKTSPAKYIHFLAGEVDRGYAEIPTPRGMQECAIMSPRGVKALCAKRKRKVDSQVSAFVNREVKRLAPPKPKRSEAEPLAPGCIEPLNGQAIRFVIIDELPWYDRLLRWRHRCRVPDH